MFQKFLSSLLTHIGYMCKGQFLLGNIYWINTIIMDHKTLSETGVCDSVLSKTTITYSSNGLLVPNASDWRLSLLY